MLKNNIRICYAVILIVTGICIYFNSLNVPFVLDDERNIVNNVNITDVYDFRAIADINTHSKYFHTYASRFIGYLSFAINYHIHQLDVVGYHWVNIGIHILAALLIWWLIRMLLDLDRRCKYLELSQQKDIFSFLCAMIFLVHPIQTQAVTYVVQRLTSLATLFYLSSVCFYLKGRCANIADQKSFIYFVISIVSAVLGMFTKEIVFTLPLAILLIEYIFIPKGRRISWKSKMFISMFLLIIPATRSFDFMNTFYQSASGQGLNSYAYMITQFYVIVKYIGLLLIPYNQNLDHHIVLFNHFLDPTIIISFCILMALIAVAFYCRKKHKMIMFGILWFFLTLSVESSIIPLPDVMFEHRLYLPSIGFIVAVMYGMCYFMKGRKIYLMGTMVLVVFSFMTIQRNTVWNDPVVLWSDVIKKSPNKYRGYQSRAVEYFKLKQYNLMIEDANNSIRLNPKDYKSYSNLGVVYSEQGDYKKALEHHHKSISLKPDNATGYSNLGLLYLKQELYDRSVFYFKKALLLDPSDFYTYNNMGFIYLKHGRYDEGIVFFKKGLLLNPNYVDFYTNLGGGLI